MRKLIYNLQKNQVLVVLDGNRITITVQGRTFFANYPCRIEEVETYLIDLMIWITFFDFGENQKGTLNGSYLDLPPHMAESYLYPSGRDKIMLEYSGGVDSSAVYLLLPKEQVVPINCYRSYDTVYGHNQDKVIKAVGGQYIETDFELIREMYINDRGYNIGIGYIAPCFPLMNILGCKYMTLGVVWDDNAFWYGEPMRYNLNCSKTQTETVGEILQMYDIHLTYPTAGLSEVWTSRLVNDSWLKDLACSCHTEKMVTNLCKHCWKCFRKLGFIGEQLDFTNQKTWRYIEYMLSKRPLKMAASTVYGIQHAYKGEPFFEKYMEPDVTFCERYNDAFMKRWNQPEIYSYMIEKFKELGIAPQTDRDHENIVKFVDYINSDKPY